MKPSRNDPCPCGSGKKYKHCCGRKAAPGAADFDPLLALFNARRYAELEDRVRSLLVQYPDAPFAWQLLGGALQMQGKDALAAFQQAADLSPQDARAQFNLGVACKSAGRLDQAVAGYRRALALQPDYVEALCNLAGGLQDFGQLDEALLCYRRALLLQPDAADTHNNLGTVLKELGRLDEALACYRHALAIKPDYADALYNLGNVLKDLARMDEAVLSYRQALRFKPDAPLTLNNLGFALKESGDVEGAMACYRRVIGIDPLFAEAHSNLGSLLQTLGRTDEALSCYQKALEIKPDYFEAHSTLLFSLNYAFHFSPAAYLNKALRYGEKVAETSTPFLSWRCALKSPRLKVGLISGDLVNHSVAHFLESLLSQINSSKVELIAYPTQPKEDDLTARIKPFFSEWKPLFNLSDAGAAQLIHADGIHILLDLSGHTAHNRLPVFAWKPAPVQCTWLGLPTTTGVAAMDYILGDPVAIPAEDEGHFSEKVWRLPEIYLCLSAPVDSPDVGSLPALRNDCITLASFNNLAKVNDQVVACWASILHAMPKARLFLKAKQLKILTVQETTLKRFATHGIANHQLILEGTTPLRNDHLATYQRVDIALDPFPYPGVTTSAEALWMGVPVLTLQGDRFLSRTAASIAHNTGMSDWIATSEADYVDRAVRLAGDLPALARLRAGLREQVRLSPLFDAPRFARHFEDALWEMWQKRDNPSA